uniref:Uncharacterized protein n=1 Tax=Meloidogyne javanica TaxID=6303 RepID=A0A915MA61_MELJA
MEMLTYASDYIKCVDSIYEATIKVNHDAYNITVELQNEHRAREFLYAFMLTKPIFIANELSRMLADPNFRVELRLIRQLMKVLIGEDFEFEKYFKDNDVRAFVKYRFYVGTDKWNHDFRYIRGLSRITYNPDWEKIMGFSQSANIRNLNQEWKDSCDPAWFNQLRGLNSKGMLQKLSLDEPLAMHYLLYLAGCSVIAINDKQLTNDSEIKQVEDNLRWATMLSFNVKRIQNRFQYTRTWRADISKFLIRNSSIGQFYKDVFKRSFELETHRFFTDFDQIDYQGLPQYVGGSFEYNGFFKQFNNWANFMCPGLDERGQRRATHGNTSFCTIWRGFYYNIFGTLVNISTENENIGILFARIFHFANSYGEFFMDNINKFFGQLENYTPDDSYADVTKEQAEFASETVGIFVNKFNQKKMNDIEIYDDHLKLNVRGSFMPLDPQTPHLNNFYNSIHEINVLQGGIFEPIGYNYNREETRKAELGRMAMALYTIQGLAHLFHVMWPIAQNVLFEKKCDYYGDHGIFIRETQEINQNEDWLKYATRLSQSKFVEIRGGISQYAVGEEIRECNDNWIMYYLARNGGEFEYTLAEIMPPQRTGESSYGQGDIRDITPVFTPEHQFGEFSYAGQHSPWGTPQHAGTSHGTPQPYEGYYQGTPQHAGTSQGTPQYGGQRHGVRKQKKRGLSKFFSCLNPKTKDDRRRKRSISSIFLDKIVRHKRMYQPGPSGSSTPTRGSSLTVTDCGHWLAPIWFGFNLMLFILGWMLLAIQYYPMF